MRGNRSTAFAFRASLAALFAREFGDYADTIADAAFWTWLTLRHEPSRTVRAAAIAAWALPVAAVTAVAISRGTMPERPRPALLRPAAAMQGIVGSLSMGWSAAIIVAAAHSFYLELHKRVSVSLEL